MPSRPRTRPRRLAARCALLSGLAVLTACGSDATGPGGGIEGDGPITLVAPASVVAPHQVTTITVRGGRLTGDGYAGSLGALELLAGRVDDSTVALVVPGATPAGEQSLRLQIGGAEATATLRVGAAVTVVDAATYLLGVDSLFRGRIMAAFEAAEAFAATGSSAADPSAFSADRQLALTTLDQARVMFDELTPEEQREAANIVLASYGRAASGASSQALRAQMANAGENDLDPAVCRYRDYPRTVVETEYCAQLKQQKIGFWQTDTEKCAADAQKAAQKGIRPRIRNFLWQVVNGCHYASLSAWTAETWASIDFATLPEFDLAKQFEEFDPLAPFDVRASRMAGGVGVATLSRTAGSAATTMSATTAAAPLHFSPGTPTTLTPRVRFRAMTTSDVGKVPAATEQAQLLTALAASWQKLNGVLGTGLTQGPATMGDVIAAAPRQLQYPVSRLRLGAVSPSTVRGTASVVDGRWTLTFDADERVADTPFTFDVIYDGGKYGSDTMTVAAVLGGMPDRYTGTFDGAGIANSYDGDGTFACQWYYEIKGAAVTAVYGPAASADAPRTVTFTVKGTYKRDPMHGSAENPNCPAGTGSFDEVVTGTATGSSRSFDLADRTLLDWPTTHWKGGITMGAPYRLGAVVRLSGFGGVVYETTLDLGAAAGQ